MPEAQVLEQTDEGEDLSRSVEKWKQEQEQVRIKSRQTKAQINREHKEYKMTKVPN